MTRYHGRILERIEFVRAYFPELDAYTVYVGLARKRGMLGWGSMDPERPGIWVRPLRLAYFTVAHEFTHLLQARGLVPRGERACDLWALARAPELIDHPPTYLELPEALKGRASLTTREAGLLHDAATDALVARARGERRYLARFERKLAGGL